MKTYEINVENTSSFIKTDAPKEDIQQAITFVKKGDKYIDRLLQALRILGHKATEVKIEPVDIFIVE